MPGTVFVRGGFGSDYEGRMSDSLRARIATADAEYDRQAARERHERDEQAAALREANVVASIRAAQERGELVDVRAAYRDGGVGRTPREAIEYASAMGDVEDMREAARERAAFRAWQEEQWADSSADMSAPTAAEIDERELMVGRAASFRAKRKERAEILRQSRALARMDAER